MMKRYFEDLLPAEELEQLKYIPTIPEFVEWIESKWHDLPALSDMTRTYTYGEMCERIACKRSLLYGLGLQEGDHVAILDNTTTDAVEIPCRDISRICSHNAAIATSCSGSHRILP